MAGVSSDLISVRPGELLGKKGKTVEDDTRVCMAI